MIRLWANGATRRFALEGKQKFSGLNPDRAIRIMALLNEAKSLSDIESLNNIGLHPLKGQRKGKWAVTVNGPWRVFFEFRDGDVYEVEIVDYH